MTEKKTIEKTKTEEKKELPKIEKKEKKKVEYNPWNILEYPHLAEKSMNLVEMENKLIFIVKRNATRKKIKEAVEKGFNVKVEKVNIETTRKGLKKAYVKLYPEYSASDIATRLGML
jgi:large subunit ribosomal protein L23